MATGSESRGTKKVNGKWRTPKKSPAEKRGAGLKNSLGISVKSTQNGGNISF